MIYEASFPSICKCNLYRLVLLNSDFKWWYAKCISLMTNKHEIEKRNGNMLNI